MSGGYARIVVTATNGDQHVFEDIDHLSLVNEESYGPGRTFGVKDEPQFSTLIVCTPNTVAVEVEA